MIKVYRGLSRSERQVAEMYGIDKDYMDWALSIRPKLPDFISERIETGKKPEGEDAATQLQSMCLAEQTTENDYRLIRHCKFYMALQANEILKETPVPEICRMFGNCSRGVIQTV